MIVSGYTLDLYCDTPGCENGKPTHKGGAPMSFFDEHGSECRKNARKMGWKLDVRNSKAYCPKCKKK